jgi:hypothetical protein
MTRKIASLAILAALSGTTGPVSAAGTASFSAQVQSSYTAMDAAIAHKNLRVAFAYYANDYVRDEGNGRTEHLLDKEQEVATVMAHTQSMKCITRVNGVARQGNKANVTITQYLVATGPDPRTGQSATIASTDVAREVWVSRGGQWRIVSGKILSNRSTLNGRPFGGR